MVLNTEHNKIVPVLISRSYVLILLGPAQSSCTSELGVKLGNSQSRSIDSSALGREVGACDGDLSAPGALQKKAGRLFLDKSSAIPSQLPGIYLQHILNWLWAS